MSFPGTRKRGRDSVQQPALMFGIGATRAGTTWLYRYLRAHPECHLRAVKELHWFNTHENDRFDARVETLDAVRARAEADLRAAEVGDPARVPTLRTRLRDHDELIDLTRRRAGHDAWLRWVEDGRGAETRLVGDITPAYALLSEATLRLMAGLRSAVRFVLVLRDPLARLWSNIRQMAGRGAPDPAKLERRALRGLRSWLAGDNPPIAARADYAGMFARLDAALDPRMLYVEFHERLFSDAAVARLCGFLGLTPQPAPLTRKVHAAAPVALDPALAAAARARLEPQYAFMRNRFGSDLPVEWNARTTEV